jgi:hypothetical protein
MVMRGGGGGASEFEVVDDGGDVAEHFFDGSHTRFFAYPRISSGEWAIAVHIGLAPKEDGLGQCHIHDARCHQNAIRKLLKNSMKLRM